VLVRALLVFVLVMGGAAPPAAAEEDDGFVPNDRLETAWFACGGSTPEWALNYRLGDATPTWSADAEPEGSWTAGDGCGSAHPSLVNGTEQESPYNLSFAGTFTGNLDTVTVRLHNAFVGRSRGTGGALPIDVRVTVGDLSVFGVEEFTGTDIDGGTFETVTHTGPATRTMTVEPRPSDDGLSEVFELSITEIDYLLPDDDTEHRVVLTVAAPFSAANAQNAWAWGAQETPSSITFNEPAEPTRFNRSVPREEREPHHYPE
jgi:hypothetical protein